MKKALSIIIALLLVATMGLTAFAAEDTNTYSITINNEATGHTYYAYQIFDGDYSDGKLSNITWGSGIDSSKYTTLIASGNAVDYANYLLAEGTDIEVEAAKIAAALSETASGTSTYSESTKTYTISGLKDGYYIVIDSADGTTVADGYSSYIVEVLGGDEEIALKSVAPTMTKKLKDINDSTDTTATSWQDSADHDVGDQVEFKLEAVIPGKGLEYYSFYTLTFHDEMCAGLTLVDGSFAATINGVTYEDFDVIDDPDDSCSFEVYFENILANLNKGEGDTNTVVVTYKATLNENSVIGSAGNPNVANLEYSNNPNQELENGNVPSDVDTAETPDDKVIVFTYKVVVNKVDGDDKPLAGAEFKLEKYNKTTEEWEAVTLVKAADGYTFTAERIDDGEYRLTETATPAGYNTAAPIEFTVEAGHVIEADDPTLTTLTGETLTGDVNTGILSTKVVNNAGTTLPETGGIGTTIFYVVGGLLMVAAIVVLVAKKRVSAED